MKIGILTISDRASQGVYVDRGGPAIVEFLKEVLTCEWEPVARIIPDEQPLIELMLKEMCDDEGCCLVVTTGGTGPSKRDVTPEATEAVCDKMMPGFGELMRLESLKSVPTAILSRQTAGIRGKSLIVNLPGQPKSIQETLEGLKDAQGQQQVPGIFAAVPYCIDLIGGPYLETNDAVCKAFRPKSAVRPARPAA